MRDLIKVFLCIALSFSIGIMPLSAKEKINKVANIQHEFSTSNVPSELLFKTPDQSTTVGELVIPPNSIVSAEILQAQTERRWHKSGLIVCKLKNYKSDDDADVTDVSGDDIYFVVRKHKPIDKKDATILGTELIITNAASIVGSCFIYFAPVDIVYFFTKGAIQRQKHPNWFKAGVSNAYDNSICWFWLKGKPIELEENDSIKFQGIEEKKALKMTSKIAKRNQKLAVKAEKKQAKLEKNAPKRLAKEQKKEQKRLLKEQKRRAKKVVEPI